jgi:glycine/D-amino acid oxidase-like deaminating enzyme
MSSKLPGLIVGAGIRGLTAALCLHARGIAVEFYASVAGMPIWNGAIMWRAPPWSGSRKYSMPKGVR